jgi:hypothetical protein
LTDPNSSNLSHVNSIKWEENDIYLCIHIARIGANLDMKYTFNLGQI